MLRFLLAKSIITVANLLILIEKNVPFSVDTVPPLVTGCTPSVSVSHEIGGALPRVLWREPTTWDISGNITRTSSHQPGGVFDIGTTNVSYLFADNAGNTATCDIEIIVKQGLIIILSRIMLADKRMYARRFIPHYRKACKH